MTTEEEESERAEKESTIKLSHLLWAFLNLTWQLVEIFCKIESTVLKINRA